MTSVDVGEFELARYCIEGEPTLTGQSGDQQSRDTNSLWIQQDSLIAPSMGTGTTLYQVR